jgi:hypothetical protein
VRAADAGSATAHESAERMSSLRSTTLEQGSRGGRDLVPLPLRMQVVRSLLALLAVLPALGLPTAPGWTSRASGRQVWATTQTQVAGLVPLDVFTGLKHLRAKGIVLWASVEGRGEPTFTFKRSRWPVKLSAFRLDHAWEGQPAANVEQRLDWVGVGGWRLDSRVYFGTQHPSRALVAKAQAELDRLQLPRR